MNKILTDKNWQSTEKALPEDNGQDTRHEEPKIVAKVDEVRVDLETGTITLRIAKEE
jgi:hypothetical protein